MRKLIPYFPVGTAAVAASMISVLATHDASAVPTLSTDNGTTIGTMTTPFYGNAYSAFWRAGNADYSLLTDSLNTFLNAPSSDGQIFFRVRNTTHMTLHPLSGLSVTRGIGSGGTIEAHDGVQVFLGPSGGTFNTPVAAIDGWHQYPSSPSYGVRGVGISAGVRGESSSGNGLEGKGAGGASGVYGHNFESWGYGVAGRTFGTNAVAVYGDSSGKSGSLAGRFDGNVSVNGTLSKTAGSFLIDHPLDRENKILRHSFVEAPEMLNVYSGTVKLDERGEAWVALPAYFAALNRDYRYQLTNIGAFAPTYVAEEVKENKFKISGGKAGMKVSWQVSGVRQDAYAMDHRIVVEEEKAPQDRGRYVYARPGERPMIGGPAGSVAEVAAHRAPMGLAAK